MKLLLTLFLITLSAAAQSPRTHLEATSLPDAPSVLQPKTLCHWEWSTPRDSTSGTATGHEVCTTAQPRSKKSDWHDMAEIPPQRTVHFFTFRGSWQDPPLRTNQQVAKSKMFWLANGAGWATAIIACRNSRSNETWGSEMPAMAGASALSYLGFRFFSGGFMLGPPLYAAAHYSYASTR